MDRFGEPRSETGGRRRHRRWALARLDARARAICDARDWFIAWRARDLLGDWLTDAFSAPPSAGGDPFEMGSARPLDFGHWAAHKLEQLSHFQISHGDAVAIGIALDVIYSRAAGLLAASACERILQLLEQLGFKLFADELLNTDHADQLTILSGLEEFREHLGGELTITLLNEIGSGIEVHEIDSQKIVAAIHELRARKK